MKTTAQSLTAALLTGLVLGSAFGLATASSAYGAAQEFALERGKVKIDVPEEWDNAQDLFGMPLTLLGPEKDGARPVITVTPTGLDAPGLAAPVAEKTLAKEQSEYREGRKQWLKKMNGKAISFSPYRKIAWDGVSAAHVIGYRYELNGTEFAESSYYVVCKNKLFHLKTLLRASHEGDYKKTVDDTVRSFTCE